MTISDTTAIVALVLSIFSMTLSLLADRRSKNIEKEEKRRNLLTRVLSLHSRLDRTIPIAKTVVVELAEASKAEKMIKSLISTIKSMEEMKNNAMKLLSDIKKVNKLNQHDLEKEITWIALGEEMLNQVEPTLPDLLELGKLLKIRENGEGSQS